MSALSRLLSAFRAPKAAPARPQVPQDGGFDVRGTVMEILPAADDARPAAEILTPEEIETWTFLLARALGAKVEGQARRTMGIALSSGDIGRVCEALQSLRRKQTPRTGTDPLYRTLAPEYFTGCPKDLKDHYEHRQIYWQGLSASPDGAKVNESSRGVDRCRTVDFRLRLERLQKLMETGRQIADLWFGSRA